MAKFGQRIDRLLSEISMPTPQYEQKPEGFERQLPGYGPFEGRELIWEWLNQLDEDQLFVVMYGLGYEADELEEWLGDPYFRWNIMALCDDDDSWAALIKVLKILVKQ